MSDWALSNGTEEFREEERRHRNRSEWDEFCETDPIAGGEPTVSVTCPCCNATFPVKALIDV